MTLRLLHFEACPFCEKIRLSLARMGLAYEGETIEPEDRRRVNYLPRPCVVILPTAFLAWSEAASAGSSGASWSTTRTRPPRRVTRASSAMTESGRPT